MMNFESGVSFDNENQGNDSFRLDPAMLQQLASSIMTSNKIEEVKAY